MTKPHSDSPKPGNETSSQPTVDTSLHWENPRSCCTCLYFYRNTADPIQPGCPACAMRQHTRGEHHRACSLYSPKETD